MTENDGPTIESERQHADELYALIVASDLDNYPTFTAFSQIRGEKFAGWYLIGEAREIQRSDPERLNCLELAMKNVNYVALKACSDEEREQALAPWKSAYEELKNRNWL